MINTADVDILPALSHKAEKDSSPSTKNADVDEDSNDGLKKEEEAQSGISDSEQGDFPWRWKLTALALGIFLSVGSSFSESTLGPLKSTLIRELKIDNAQYGAISSASSLVNTVLPIVGGYGLDYYGVEWGSLVCSVFIFLGAVISAAGTNNDSFKLVLTGRIVLGLGSTVIETCTSKILAHWFRKRGLGFVYGVDISFGKLVVLAARAAAVPMRDASSFWGWALWIPAIICFVNLVQNILYVWWVRSLPEWTRMPDGRRAAAHAHTAGMDSPTLEDTKRALSPEQTNISVLSNKFNYRHPALPNFRGLLHVPRFFWLVVCTQIMQSGVVGGFNGLSADIISETRGSTAQTAGYTTAMQQIIPIVLCPLLGGFFDFFGNRMLVVSFTSAIWVLVYALIGYTTANALGIMILSSLALAFNALPFIASIPLMVPSQLELGLAFGIWKAFNNCGSVIVDMIAGRLQDITPGKTYERVIAFFIAWKALEFCLGLFYGVLDRRYLGGILTMSERKRKRLEDQDELPELLGRKSSKVATYCGIAVLLSMIIIAWVLFIKYSL